MVDMERQGFEKMVGCEAVWRNKENGMYYGVVASTPYLVDDLAFGEASDIGIKRADYELYKGENEKIKARRKAEFAKQQAQKKLDDTRQEQGSPVPPARRVNAEVVRDLPAPLAGRDIVKPIASVNDIVEAFNRLQEIKSKVLVKDDFVTIGGKDVLRKSGYRKLKAAFGLDMSLISEERRDLGDGEYEYIAHVRVTAPNGTFVEAKSSSSSIEPHGLRQKAATVKLIKEFNREVKPEMIVFAVRGMAQTRAYNRAISDLVAGGETSAEELVEE